MTPTGSTALQGLRAALAAATRRAEECGKELHEARLELVSQAERIGFLEGVIRGSLAWEIDDQLRAKLEQAIGAKP